MESFVSVIPTGQTIYYMRLIATNGSSARAYALEYFTRFNYSNLPFRATARIRSMLYTNTISVPYILTHGIPFKIRNMVISLISIFVVYRAFIFGIRNKSLGDHTMHGFSMLTVIIEYSHGWVSARIDRRH
jgi:hypothetical protein